MESVNLVPKESSRHMLNRARSIAAWPSTVHQPTYKTPQRHLRILVAEDVPTNQLLVRSLLEGRGHKVDVAENGREALSALADGKFDVVLMDVHMPVMDGLEATRAIRARDGWGLPIVAFSAYGSESDRSACFEAGMNAFLAKPADIAQMIRTLENVCK